MIEIIKKIAHKFSVVPLSVRFPCLFDMKEEINDLLWGCTSEIQIKVNTLREQTINILLPDVYPHMSAGPLSVLYFARFLVENKYSVRLIVCSGKNLATIKRVLLMQDESISQIVERIEITTTSSKRGAIIEISENDMTVATLFNTAFIAKHIQSKCRNPRFIYFIQDDEREFFAASSLKSIVEETYNLNFYPIYSTKILQDFFYIENIGNIRQKEIIPIFQNCPANSFLPVKQIFLNRKSKRLVVYSRPSVKRNCFEYVIYILRKAIELGILNSEWEVYGLGFPIHKDCQIINGVKIKFLPNMSLAEYKKILSTFDVGLSLMATPHPSMPPIDLALSGCLVVTNSYQNKNFEVMQGISKNILCVPLTSESLLAALKQAITQCENLEDRYINALDSKWPKSWEESFNETHREWISQIMNNCSS